MALKFAAGAYIEQLASSIGALSVSTAAAGIWFRRNGVPAGNQPMIMTKSSGVNQGWGFYLELTAGASQNKFGLFASDTSAVNSLNFLASTQVAFDGSWHLASANIQTANGAQNDVYMDGGGKVSANSSRVWNMTDHPFRLARAQDAFWGSFDGDLAHAFFYNETLTDGEHYALACGVSPLLIRPHALLLYYPLMIHAPTFNLVKSISTLAAPTTSGTITHATYGPPQEPIDGGSPYDPMWWAVAPTAPPVLAHRRFTPIRGARRR